MGLQKFQELLKILKMKDVLQGFFSDLYSKYFASYCMDYILHLNYKANGLTEKYACTVREV